ncbi:hypothetical protein PgNI_11318 [Pyricularia grisea]|uniref:Uncharacterized protein n=1 Tax=Pyricularia grisea TaxID=148305 RepID=A0A6P8APB2_PYRGI|nr:hypothetical protein PgNI_11318 [Pyricularia grisea]TLD03879.1 hypothetical protein PgNI_11318 [Pyricularia grisea]
MKTSPILTFVIMVTAALALPAVTTNTENIHIAQRENEIGTPKMHRRSPMFPNSVLMNAYSKQVGECLIRQTVIDRYPDWHERLRYCINGGN